MRTVNSGNFGPDIKTLLIVLVTQSSSPADIEDYTHTGVWYTAHGNKDSMHTLVVSGGVNTEKLQHNINTFKYATITRAGSLVRRKKLKVILCLFNVFQSHVVFGAQRS